MKVGQNTIVRWVTKLIAKGPGRASDKPVNSLRVLDAEQLRQVGGGSGTSTQLPHKGW
jgi:hypothetical protein